jgi:hypothetical protein
MSIDTEINTLKQVLADESQVGFWRRRKVAKLLAKRATYTDDRGNSLSPGEARALIEALVAGLESVHRDKKYV